MLKVHYGHFIDSPALLSLSTPTRVDCKLEWQSGQIMQMKSTTWQKNERLFTKCSIKDHSGEIHNSVLVFFSKLNSRIGDDEHFAYKPVAAE